jgi:hypothetical protein
MAYVELRPEADGGHRPWLEGRRLEAGDPLWVPVCAVAGEFVEAWEQAVFVEVNAGGGTLTIANGQGREALSLRTGLRRRDVKV